MNLKVALRRAFLHPVALLRSVGSFALSHHPECKPFDHHCLHLRGHRLCIGCFVGYPVFIASIASLYVLSFIGIHSFLNIQFASPEAFLVGTALQVTVLLGKVFNTSRVSVKVAFKSAQAVGLAFMFFPVLTLGIPILLKIYIVFILWASFNAITGAVRMYEISKTCKSCEYKFQWSKCPGFKGTVDRLYEAGFLTS